MRLRGPWLITGAHLDTAQSSQSGTIPASDSVEVVMNAYTFAPDMVHTNSPFSMFVLARLRGLDPPDPDIPRFGLWNQSGVTATYMVHWRFVNP